MKTATVLTATGIFAAGVLCGALAPAVSSAAPRMDTPVVLNVVTKELRWKRTNMRLTDSILRLRYRYGGRPNTGEPLWASAVTRIAVNTIHHDAEHPSHVTLPLIQGVQPCRRVPSAPPISRSST